MRVYIVYIYLLLVFYLPSGRARCGYTNVTCFWLAKQSKKLKLLVWSLQTKKCWGVFIQIKKGVLPYSEGCPYRVAPSTSLLQKMLCGGGTGTACRRPTLRVNAGGEWPGVSIDAPLWASLEHEYIVKLRWRLCRHTHGHGYPIEPSSSSLLYKMLCRGTTYESASFKASTLHMLSYATLVIIYYILIIIIIYWIHYISYYLNYIYNYTWEGRDGSWSCCCM